MTRLFKQIRYGGYAAVFVFSAVVLGVSAYLANQFLPDIHHDLTIFALVPPAYTILLAIILLIVSTPRIEVLNAFIAGLLWLILGAWLSDSIGSTRCSALVGSVTPTTNGSMPSDMYCKITKVQEAFAWALFVMFAAWFFVVLRLTQHSLAMGREFIWTEDVGLLPWFGQAPSFPGMEEGQYPEPYRPPYGYPGYQNYYPQPNGGGAVYPGGTMQSAYSVQGGQGYVQQLPGHATVIQGGHVTHVPTASVY